LRPYREITGVLCVFREIRKRNDGVERVIGVNPQEISAVPQKGF
jgi:hypothetical protein